LKGQIGMEFLPGFGFRKTINDVFAPYQLQVKAHFTGPCASVYTPNGIAIVEFISFTD